MTAQLVETSRRPLVRPVAAVLLVVYGVSLAVIAFWPTPVDQGAGPLLRALARAVPWLTYDVVEFTANILLFVPLGVLLAVLLGGARVFVVPIAVAASLAIEAGQAVLLPGRTATMRDVVANAAGALVGLALVWWGAERSRRTATAGER